MDPGQRPDQASGAPPPAEGNAPAAAGAGPPPQAEGTARQQSEEPAGPSDTPADVEEAEEAESDPEMDAWLMKTLQRVQPGTEISQEGVQVSQVSSLLLQAIAFFTELQLRVEENK